MPSKPAAPRSKVIVRVLLGIHISVTTVFCVLLAAGVWREVSPADLPPPGPPAAVESCLQDAVLLREELLGRITEVLRASPATGQEREFQRWSMAFRRRIAGTRARCEPPAGASPSQAQAIGAAFDAVGHLHALSELQVAHWARHVGPAADRAAAALRSAEELK